ncbi:hypothetical protein J45TS6_41790 [Paenibacillus sp. J45TS6]|nr:hypothetical protein J45TS6_41790 [Paenibacillus sp. J45TS6]
MAVLLGYTTISATHDCQSVEGKDIYFNEGLERWKYVPISWLGSHIRKYW